MLKLLTLAGCIVFASATLPISGKENFVKGKSLNKDVQLLTCYEYAGQGGDSVELKDYAPVLANYDFNNRAASCCFIGIWLLYDEENFNVRNPNGAGFQGWGENLCMDFDNTFKQKASSARYTGAPDGYKFSTINLYEGDNYVGDEQYYYQDASTVNKDNLGASIIVTGCDRWTVYPYDNYQGQGTCLVPSDETNCYPSFFRSNELPSDIVGHISSVRRGCLSNTIVKADLEFAMKTRMA